MKLSVPIKIQGFTLLEVLIAMLIFAIGMLGLAGMQGVALKDNNDAYMRSQAVFFAYDMGDRIRANPAYWGDANIMQLNQVAGDTALLNTRNTVEAFGVYPFCSTDDPPASPVGTDPVPVSGFCSSQQLAQYDWYRVRTDIINALPNGALTITRLDPGDPIPVDDPAVADARSVLRIKVTWDMTNTAVSIALPSFTYDVRP